MTAAETLTFEQIAHRWYRDHQADLIVDWARSLGVTVDAITSRLAHLGYDSYRVILTHGTVTRRDSAGHVVERILIHETSIDCQPWIRDCAVPHSREGWAAQTRTY